MRLWIYSGVTGTFLFIVGVRVWARALFGKERVAILRICMATWSRFLLDWLLVFLVIYLTSFILFFHWMIVGGSWAGLMLCLMTTVMFVGCVDSLHRIAHSA